MGRVTGTAGSGSGGHWETSRTRPDRRNRGKQKKRKKDLEELHRNVLEAKKKLHRTPSRDTKWKTAFAKVLANFADQRQRNDDTIHKKKADKSTHGTRANPRTICSRLLPEPIVGMYENGAKGRQAHRVGGDMGGAHIARLEGNVLKLLNGDETNPNSSENSAMKRAKKIELACTKKPVESNSTSKNSRFTVGSPVFGKIKGDKCINWNTEKNLTDREEPVKPRDQPHPRRDNTCKRRLFEPDDESACDENSFRIIDRSKIMDEICFSPTRRMPVDNSGSDNRVKKYLILDADRARGNPERQADSEKSAKKFWDCSPYLRYERFCSKIHSKIFESDVQRIARDPTIKIRMDLTELYGPSNHWMELIAGETSNHRRLVTASIPENSPLDDFSVSTLAETERGISDLELDQESSDSSTMKVGSWHSSNFCGISSENDDTRSRDKSKKSRVVVSKLSEDEPQRRSTRKNRVSKENSSTTNPVSLFLKTLGDKNPSNGRKGLKTFAADVAVAAELCGAKEKSDNYLGEVLHVNPNTKSRGRKNRKHVPTILRRSNSRAGLLKGINANPEEPRRRGKNKIDPRTDTQFNDYPRHTPGSSWSTIAGANDSELIGTPSFAGDTPGVDPQDVVTKLDFTRGESQPPLKNIGRDASWEVSTDAESTDDALRDESVPTGRCVDEDHARKSRTRVAHPRGIGKRRVTFDVDEQHFYSSQTSKPREQSPCPVAASNGCECLAPYHDNAPSEVSRIFSKNDVETQNLQVRFPSVVSNIEQQSINRDFDAYNLSSERLASESVYGQPSAPEQRIRKPVVLFKPIQSMGQNRQRYQSSYENLDSAFATVSDAGKHLNVRNCPEKPRDHSCPRQQCSVISPARQNMRNYQQQHPKQALTRTVRKNSEILIDENAIRREVFDVQPSKFLAIQRGDGDPQRFPICAYADRPRVVVEPVPMVFDGTNNDDLTYIKCLETKNSAQQQQQHHHHHHYYHQVDPACGYRSSTLDAPRKTYAKRPSPRVPPPGIANEGTVNILGMEQLSPTQIRWAAQQPQLHSVVACPGRCSQQQRPSDDVAPAAAALALIPMSNDVPRSGCDILLPTSQLSYKPRYTVNTGLNSGILVNSRIQLADGKIGTFVPDNRQAFGIGRQTGHNVSRGSAQLPLVGTRSSPVFLQQQASDGIALLKAPRNIFRMVNCENVVANHIKYKPQYSDGSFNEREAIPNRVQLADGTIGTFVPETRSAGNTVFFNDDRRTFDSVRNDETGCSQDLHGPASQEICSSSACQCNPVYYNANAVYPDRVTCAIRNADSFAAL